MILLENAVEAAERFKHQNLLLSGFPCETDVSITVQH